MPIDDKFKDDVVSPKIIAGIKRYNQYDKDIALTMSNGSNTNELAKIRDDFYNYLSRFTNEELDEIFDYCVLNICI